MYGIYANIWGILMVNVTIYGSTMDPMGYTWISVKRGAPKSTLLSSYFHWDSYFGGQKNHVQTHGTQEIEKNVWYGLHGHHGDHVWTYAYIYIYTQIHACTFHYTPCNITIYNLYIIYILYFIYIYIIYIWLYVHIHMRAWNTMRGMHTSAGHIQFNIV